MFMRVIHHNELVVTKRVLLSRGLKIQDGCQSWPLIATKNCSCYMNYFERNRTAISVTKPFILGLVFITNDNVDNKKLFYS